MNIVTDWFRKHFADPQIVSLFLLLVLSWALLTFLTSIFAPLFTAMVIAYLLEGPVTLLEQRGLRRSLAAALVWLVFMLLMVAAIANLGPLLLKQSSQMLQELPSIIEALRGRLERIAASNPAIFSTREIGEVTGSLSIDVHQMRNELMSRSHLLGAGLTLMVIYLILMPILVLFFLKDKLLIQRWARSFLPTDISLITQIWRDMDGQIANYVRGKVLEILIVWAAAFVVYRLLGLNYAMLLSAVTGFSVLVPWAGATLVTIPVAAVAYAQFGLEPKFAWVMLSYAVLQALDGNVLVPIIFSETNNLHPAAIIMAVLFFGGVWGFWGVFFAIPLATLVQAVIKAWPRAEHATLVTDVSSASGPGLQPDARRP